MSKLYILNTDLNYNSEFLSKKIEDINKIIDANSNFKQGYYLSGNTAASDLKTAGGNILFLDAGFANVLVRDVNQKVAYIPKLYSGVSIYFRPIDKNTRQNRFPKKYPSDYNSGCKVDKTGDYIYGPDYSIISTSSIWQHLCLSIGVTFGSIQNSDFDNFYNNTSLLVGPAYRFARAFKVSAGTALLKGKSENPLISQKKVIAGGYISLSVDVDFIQGIKDFSSILFK